MKQFIAPAYTFTPGASGVGTVNLSGISGFNVKYLVSIVNQTKGVVIYSTASDALKFTNVSGTTVTLNADTTGQSSGDILQVIYDDPANTVNTGLSQPLTDAQLRATALPVSASSLPLPSGAATSANQATANSSLSSIDGKLGSLGQKTMAGSTPVVIASDQAAIPVTGTFTSTNSANGNTGSAVPAQATMVGGTDGTNLRAVRVSSTGVVSVDGSAVTQPISAAALPLPSGAATSTNQTTANASLASIDSKLLSALTDIPDQTTPAQPIKIVPQTKYRSSFAANIANGVDTNFFNLLQTGSGMTVSQSGGLLVITSGTTANAETIIRSVQSYKDAIAARWALSLSQRIVNTNFIVELVDVLGDNLAYTINSATSVTVTLPSSTFTSANVGQFITLQGITGAAGVPGRYAIASVSGTAITFTVAGWPASGSGTLSLVGWNYMRTTYTGTSATNATIETQRRGYNNNSTITANINATSPGHMAEMTQEDGCFAFSDSLQSASAALTLTSKAESIQSIPDSNVPLYLQIRALNGAAPASNTTLNMGMAQVVNWSSQKVVLSGVAGMAKNSALPVLVQSGALGSVGTVTTVTTVAAVTAANIAIPGIVADVTSAALTTTTTSATITPTAGISYQVNIPVTVVSGTLPTLDVSIQESDDTGTNWYTVYDFPRITATGIYRSPMIPFFGNRIRYVQTVGGTSPSFTRAINRLQASYPALAQRQMIDRTISLTTLNSTTPTLLVRDCGNATQLMINVGAITTTAPALQLEGSDDFGATWFSIGTPLTAVANSTVQLTVTDINTAFLRARVSTAGVGVTAGYVLVKAHD